MRKLGAVGVDFAVLSGFFDLSWRKPVDGLTEADKGFVLNAAGFRLRALGRLAEATQPMQAALEGEVAQKRWKRAAVATSTISELYLTIGDVTQALAYAKQSVELADCSGDEFMQEATRTKLADALHQSGLLTESQAAFHETEELQKKRQPEFPLLYSLQGYHYCDLLLSQGNYAEVERRANNDLKIFKQGALSDILSLALARLSLGRALANICEVPETSQVSQAANYLNRSVDGLRQAWMQDMLPRGLLARAEFYRVTGELDKAKRDLDEAFSIATRGGMGLFLADCHLEYARLGLVETLHATSLREHIAIAKQMIEKMGYHRRDKEVEELERQVSEIK